MCSRLLFFDRAKEIELLRKAARERGRNGHRDATMILIAYRHGLKPEYTPNLAAD